jgi:hypothetical protein
MIALILPVLCQAQQRLQPGKMYEGGEVLFAPRFGFIDTVPKGWSGNLPRESEVFMLSSMTRPIEIYVFATEKGSLNEMKLNWEKGIEMDTHIKLQAKSPTIVNGALASEVIAVGPTIDKSKRAYASARCSDQGVCVTSFAFMAATEFEEAKKLVDRFMKAGIFQPPSLGSPYEKFDWRKFLTGKAFVTFDLRDKGSKENRVDLCSDGSFTAKVDKTGILKQQNPLYKGRMKGTWTAEGIGENGTLTLLFENKKLEPLNIPMMIHEEKIMANGERYFVATSDKCK